MATDYKQYNYGGYSYCGGSFPAQGCGPTSVADIVNVSPLTVADWMTRHGYATTDGHGTYWEGINAALTAFGAGGKMVGASLDGKTACSQFDTWKRVIQGGCMGVLLMHNVVSSYWTSGGHYIACVGYDKASDKYLIYDPASSTRTGWHPWSDFVGNICCLYTSTVKWGEGADSSYTFTLKQLTGGESGNDVLLLQRILYSRSFYAKKSGLDGACGPKTIAAVKKYQKTEKKLAADGKCGPHTWQTLMGFEGTVNVSQVTFTLGQIKFGDTGLFVLLLQEILTGMGLYAGSLDRSYGPATHQAVKDAQKKLGITTDGVCGPATWKKLIGI